MKLHRLIFLCLGLSTLNSQLSAQGVVSDLSVQRTVTLGNGATSGKAGTISPTQLTANTDDWAPTGFAYAFTIRATTDASRNLTGIAGAWAGRVILLSNVGSFNLVLINNAMSTAANRFALSADYTLLPSTSVMLIYDTTSSRWRILGSQTPANTATGDVVGPASSTDNAIARYDLTTGKLMQDSVIPLGDTGVLGFPDGIRQTFNPDGTNAGLNVGSYAGEPSGMSNGDLVYDSTANELKARINGATVALGAGASGGVGTLSLARWTAVENQPPAASYATFNTRNSIAVLQFDAGTAESAVFVGIIPEAADFTTGLTVRIIWAATSATSGNVVWTAAFERGNTDLDSDSFATGIDSAASAANGTSGIVTVASIDFTGSEIDGLVAGDLLRLKITRKAADGSDTMTGDAELIAVEIQQR